MDRIWQWVWDRYGTRYSWAICAVMFALFLPSFVMLSFIVVALEKSDRYVEAAAITVVALPVLVYVYFLPGQGRLDLVDQWAARRDVDRTCALDATYTWARGALSRGLVGVVVWGALLFVGVGAIAGAVGQIERGWDALVSVAGTWCCCSAWFFRGWRCLSSPVVSATR